ncbi:penicillin acylase family protein [Actinocrispum sp. NPDC049592]|uniref:penicillin acylase family protein n=1 Tax=Actinocrispum sp. NPDC049592 TaxID=3154835 RepID=UPI0034242B47
MAGRKNGLAECLAGLNGEVEVLTDRWGVPHIYAADGHDVFVAQGFVAARERLCQMDLWRRKGLGLMSAAFGPSYVEQDRAARLLLYRGAPDWSHYGPAVKCGAEAFVTGVNAFIDLCLEREELLPREFHELEYRPGHWHAEDLIRIRTGAGYTNLDQEVARAVTIAKYGPQAEDLRRFRAEGHRLVIPDGLDPADVPEDVLRDYRLATGSLKGGSNNWVIGATRTRSGRPILANDPHHAMTVPSHRFLTHLVAPGLNVIGAGEPQLPGITIGHNGSIAFGVSFFGIDQEDLYVYQTDQDGCYRYQDAWEVPHRVTEYIPVRGEAAREVSLAYTRHGPVLREQPGQMFALRAAWLEPGMAPYLGGVHLMQARDTKELRAMLAKWGAPGENYVYATPSGEIGWQAAGRVPVRRGWDGTLPVPGDGRYEWDGFRSTDLLPSSVNPPEDLIVTANEQNFPRELQKDVPIGYDWLAPQRSARIREVLTNGTKWTVEGGLGLQVDELNPLARKVVPVLLRSAGRPADPAVRRALSLLLAWDFLDSADAAAPAVFHVWFRRHLRPALLRDALAPHVRPDRLADAVEAVLPDETLAGDPRVDLQLLRSRLDDRELLRSTFADAVTELVAAHGRRPEAWRWGDLHTLTFTHPLACLLPESYELPPFPRSGSGDTVGSTAFDPSFRQVLGASLRIVIDVGAWDESVAVNAPGQSGRPESKHYDDHIDAWSRGNAFPLSYSRPAVERFTESRLVLRPPGVTDQPSALS